jgi:exosome complex component CSL4
MNDKRKVLPGDEVAEAEEYLPAEGTYEEDGKVFSALKGILELDEKEKIAKVVAEGKSRNITGDTNGTIHVSKLSQEYVQDVGREVRPSDIIRAKVTQVKPSIQLTTAGAHYGVVKALCRKCRQPLLKVEKGLYCNTCERGDMRKLADDYGDVEKI